MRKRTFAIAILVFLFAPSIGSTIGLAEAPPPTTTASSEVHEMSVDKAQIIRDSIFLHEKARPTKAFWEELAQCETGQDWQNGGKYAGGLGIYIGTWTRFGGREFAKHPSRATKDEQITVANRIAVDGYQTKKSFKTLDDRINNRPFFQEPVGLGGWGCYKSKSTGKYRMAKPRMYFSAHPFMVPRARFTMWEKGRLVKDLQTFLRITVDGEYGPKTRRAHLRYLRSKGLSTDGVPQINETAS